MYSKSRNRKRFVIPFLLSFTIIVLACSTSSFKETLHTTLEVKDLHAKSTLVNGTSETKVLSFGTGCQFSYTIKLNDEIIDKASDICTQATSTLSLAPLEKKEFKFSIKDRVNLKSGTYKLKAYVIGKGELSNELFFEVEG